MDTIGWDSGKTHQTTQGYACHPFTYVRRWDSCSIQIGHNGTYSILLAVMKVIRTHILKSLETWITRHMCQGRPCLCGVNVSGCKEGQWEGSMQGLITFGLFLRIGTDWRIVKSGFFNQFHHLKPSKLIGDTNISK